MRARATRAFTLVEVLVVVAVIGVVAGLLLPAAQRARASSHSTACRGNLRQMGHALSLYLEASDDFIPRRGQGDRKLQRIDRMSDWFNCLLPYVGSPPYCELVAQDRKPREGDDHVFLCPTARDPGWLYFLPYAMNMYVSPWIRPKPHRITEIPRPGSVVFMADASGPYSATIPTVEPYTVVARHAGRANLVFLDTHVEAFEGDYLGCGVGDPGRSDVSWPTGSGGVNWEPSD